jgi:hypothetical protein
MFGTVVEFLNKPWKVQDRPIGLRLADFNFQHLAAISAIPRKQFLMLKHTLLPFGARARGPPTSLHARHNANLSRMTLREYVIKILAEASALPETVNPTENPPS